MIEPIITFQQQSYPFASLPNLTYTETAPDGVSLLPVLQGESSDHWSFRIFNNFLLNTGVANALNVQITTWDGVGGTSHTANTAPVSQNWFYVRQIGYGQKSSSLVSTTDAYTSYNGTFQAVGGTSYYTIEVSTDGTTTYRAINAGSNNNGLGFVSLDTYASVPQTANNATYNLAWSVSFEWTS